MRERWHLPFAIHADPDGAEFLQPLGTWNPDERSGIGSPTTPMFDPRGEKVLRHRSRDFADRPCDDPCSPPLASWAFRRSASIRRPRSLNPSRTTPPSGLMPTAPTSGGTASPPAPSTGA